MLHPSYSDLMKVVNSEVEPGEAPVVNSRYSIVMATSKRARQIIAGDEPMVKGAGKKPLSAAVEELNEGKIKILSEEEAEEAIAKMLEEAAAKEKEKAEKAAAEAAAAKAKAEAENEAAETETDTQEENAEN